MVDAASHNRPSIVRACRLAITVLAIGAVLFNVYLHRLGVETCDLMPVGIYLSSDWSGSVGLSYDLEGRRFETCAAHFDGYCENVDLVPVFPPNPQARGHEVFAIPYRGSEPVPREFLIGENWRLWKDERLLFSCPAGTTPLPAVALYRAADLAPLTHVDFLQSPYAGRIRLDGNGRMLAIRDLYSTEVRWLRVDTKAGAGLFFARIPRAARNVEWILTPDHAQSPPSISTAFVGGSIQRGTGVSELLDTSGLLLVRVGETLVLPLRATEARQAPWSSSGSP